MVRRMFFLRLAGQSFCPDGYKKRTVIIIFAVLYSHASRVLMRMFHHFATTATTTINRSRITVNCPTQSQASQ